MKEYKHLSVVAANCKGSLLCSHIKFVALDGPCYSFMLYDKFVVVLVQSPYSADVASPNYCPF